MTFYTNSEKSEKVGHVVIRDNTQASRFDQPLAVGDAAKHVASRPCGFVIDIDPTAGRRRHMMYFDATDINNLGAWIDAMKTASQLAAAPCGCSNSDKRSWIKEVVQRHPVFMHIAETHVDALVAEFQGPLHVPHGTTIIKQGDTVVGNEPGLYLIESGTVDAYVAKAEQKPPGSHVYSYTQPGQIFGQVALLYNSVRSATITAVGDDVMLWHMSRDSFRSSMDGQHLQQLVDRHAASVSKVWPAMRSLSPEFAIFNVDLVSDPSNVDNLSRYYNVVRSSQDLLLTTSCFTPWHKSKKLNGYAKVIPAIHSSSSDQVRVFFFDDNIEWEGRQNSTGIANLRDVRTGAFVEFGEGMNGFTQEIAGGNSIVAHSKEFKNVVVQVNILDAMEDEDYFIKIIQKYAQPGEKIVVFMDCNATIISVDSISGKDMSEVLLGTMFQMLQVTPKEPFQFLWEGKPEITVEKTMDLKQLVKKIAGSDNEFYTHFFKWDNCTSILKSLGTKGVDVRWLMKNDEEFDVARFKDFYDRYIVTLEGGTDEEGITWSWYKLYKSMSASGHCIMLNSFGVDSRKVIVRTVYDERQVLQIVVNVELWGPKDLKAFQSLYDISFEPI